MNSAYHHSHSASGRKPIPEPLHIYWRLLGPANKAVACVLYRTDAGFELRVERTVDDQIQSEAVADIDSATSKAEAWRFALVQVGMTELPVKAEDKHSDV